MTHESLSPEGCVRLSTARPVHAKQGNLLLLIALLHLCLCKAEFCLLALFISHLSCAVPCCSWMLAVCCCVRLPLVSTSPEECRFPLLSVLCVPLCLYTSSLTLQSFLQAVAALPWNCLAGNARILHFPLAEWHGVPHLLSALFVCSLESCWP